MNERLRSERGQAIVEFVIILPLLFAVLFLIFAAAVGFSRYLRVIDAAHSAARAAAVARFNIPPNSTDACAAAQAAAYLSWGDTGIDPHCDTPAGQPGDPFTITVTDNYDVNLPFLPSATFVIRSTATSRLE
jgi:Flp pilus assembly protein TadG